MLVARNHPFCVLSLIAGFSSGVLAQRAQIPSAILTSLFPYKSESTQIKSPVWRNPFALVVVGQSNVANHGRPRCRSGTGSYAVSLNGVFLLEDPLPGASGSGGSPWPHWAALQQRSWPGSQVVVASVAQGSSAVSDWIPGGVHSQRLPDVLKALREQQLGVDAVVWHQGETESWSGGDAAAYAANLSSWIASVRALGIKAPIFMCLTSRDSSVPGSGVTRGDQPRRSRG